MQDEAVFQPDQGHAEEQPEGPDQGQQIAVPVGSRIPTNKASLTKLMNPYGCPQRIRV